MNMKTNRLRVATALFLAMAVPLTAYAQASAEDHLKRADSYRRSAANMQLDVKIVAEPKGGGDPKEKRYTVFTQAGHKSLILMQNPAEKGQKVLMLGDDYWIVMPNSTRPMRITPMQKLLGDVSAGDVSTTSWAEDYTAAEGDEETVDGTPAIQLKLQANRKGVTYQRIDLWVGKAHFQPLKADLYVQSEKLAKKASFVLDSKTEPTRVIEMILVDSLGNDRQTRVFYSGPRERTIPPAWLNPMFLANNPSLE